MNAAWRAGLVSVVGLAVSSCASIGAPTPPDTYEISAPQARDAVPSRSRKQLLVPEPTAIKTLDSAQIVVKPTPYTVEYLKNAQWSDRLPRMVQLRLVQAFENTGRIGAVGVPGQGLAIDDQVVMELRRFEISVDGGDRASVEIAVKVLNDRTGTVRATRVFRQSAAVSSADNPGYVAALNQAFDAATSEIVTWTLGIV